MLRALRSHTSRWLRLATVLATLAQGVIAAAPVADGDAERSTAAHIEDGGTSVHYAHDEASCPACAAQQLVANGERRFSDEPPRASRGAGAPEAPMRWVALRLASSNPPRAPPIVS